MATVLLVEDEPDLLLALSVRLRAAGCTCQTAGSGAEALERLQSFRPDIIVADLLMPEMNGYELLRRLKADPKTADIPVIVLTAVPEAGRAPRAHELCSAARIVQKLYDAEALIAILRELVITS